MNIAQSRVCEVDFRGVEWEPGHCPGEFAAGDQLRVRGATLRRYHPIEDGDGIGIPGLCHEYLRRPRAGLVQRAEVHGAQERMDRAARVRLFDRVREMEERVGIALSLRRVDPPLDGLPNAELLVAPLACRGARPVAVHRANQGRSPTLDE